MAQDKMRVTEKLDMLVMKPRSVKRCYEEIKGEPETKEDQIKGDLTAEHQSAEETPPRKG